MDMPHAAIAVFPARRHRLRPRHRGRPRHAHGKQDDDDDVEGRQRLSQPLAPIERRNQSHSTLANEKRLQGPAGMTVLILCVVQSSMGIRNHSIMPESFSIIQKKVIPVFSQPPNAPTLPAASSPGFFSFYSGGLSE